MRERILAIYSDCYCITIVQVSLLLLLTINAGCIQSADCLNNSDQDSSVSEKARDRRLSSIELSIDFAYVPIILRMHDYPKYSSGINFASGDDVAGILIMDLPSPQEVNHEESVIDVLEKVTGKVLVMPEYYEEKWSGVKYRKYYEDYYIVPAFPNEEIISFELKVVDLIFGMISNPPTTSDPSQGFRPNHLPDGKKWSFVVLITEGTLNFIPVIKSSDVLD